MFMVFMMAAAAVSPTAMLMALMMSAAMLMTRTGAVMTAGMSFSMFPALYIRVKLQFSIHIILYRLIRVPGNTSKEADILISEVLLRTGADASADQCTHSKLFQNTGKLAVPFSIGALNLALYDFALPDIINLKCLSSPEVLENFTGIYIISCCNFHYYSSLSDDFTFTRCCMCLLHPG